VDVRQAGVGTRRRLIDLRRTLHVESFVRTLVVEDLDGLVEAPAAAENFDTPAW